MNKKEKVIKELKTKGKVAMVGDGINDAVALKAASAWMRKAMAKAARQINMVSMVRSRSFCICTLLSDATESALVAHGIHPLLYGRVDANERFF